MRDTVLSATLRHTPVTAALIAINVVFFVLEEIWGGSETSRTLFHMGAVIPGDTLAHALPTFITYGYLHIGLIHLFMNMYGLLVLGREVEPMLGPGRFFSLYTLAMIGGGLFVHFFSSGLTAGASGALFGLLGAISFMLMLAYRASKHPEERALIRRRIGAMLLPNVVISLFPGVSFAGHLGGLVIGIVFVALAYFAGRNARKTAGARTRVANVLAVLLALVSALSVARVWLEHVPFSPLNRL